MALELKVVLCRVCNTKVQGEGNDSWRSAGRVKFPLLQHDRARIGRTRADAIRAENARQAAG